jgi:ornithine cyclodeaminase/alanine dehydrogenase
MTDHQILYLSQADVGRVNLDMATVINLLETAFREKGAGKVEMPPKPGIHTMPDAFIHAMPAYIPALKSAGIKWVSGYPENYKRSLPYITGLLILNDVETGIPYSVMDCAWITAYRTGVASALAANISPARRAKRRNIGLRCPGTDQPEALRLSSHSTALRLIFFPMQQRFVEEMSAKFGIECDWGQRPRDAVVESDWSSPPARSSNTPPHHSEGLAAAGRIWQRCRF